MNSPAQTKRRAVHQDKKRRRQQAEERQAEHDSLSLQDKIDKAKSRRGESKRELQRYYNDAPADWVDTETGQTKAELEAAR